MRSFWFPLALGLVLLLGLAGAVLVLLHLFGHVPPLGQVTSSWALPLWAGLVVLLLPVLLLLLYFLKLKRKPVAVPSTFLWRKTIEDVHVNAFIQWLRQNLLLLLQLLTLFLFLFALLALQVQGESSSGQYHIIMVDNSASMSARDVKPSRLHQARDEALTHVDGLNNGDAAMVIAFNSRAEVLQPFTTDHALLRKAIRRIEQTEAPTRIDEALLQADGRANPLRTIDDQASRPAGEDPSKARTYVAAEGVATEVHLFSDGGFPDVADFSLGKLSLRYHRIGAQTSVDNVGIVRFTAQRDEKDARLTRVIAGVMNFRNRAVSVRVQLEVKSEGVLQSVQERTLSLPARRVTEAEDVAGEDNAHFRLYDLNQRANTILHAQLLDVQDDFPLDDQAWLVVGVARKARVLLVRPTPNSILEAFLAQLSSQGLATVELFDSKELEKDAYRKGARDGSWDLVIFDRCSPVEADMPQANTFFIDAVPPPWERRAMPAIKGPRIRGWATGHPLMRNLSGLQDVAIAEGFLFDLRDPAVPGRPPRLLETDRENALLFTLARRPYTDLVMTFPLIDGNGRWNTFWPLQLSFPLFMKNVVFQMGNVEGDEVTRPGEIRRLRPEGNGKQLEVFPPAGRSYILSRGTRADFLFDRADRVGVYDVKSEDQAQRSFAVNLLDARESNLEPRAEFKIGAERVMAGATGRAVHELWKWLAVGAFVLLLAEWVLYNRRASI